MTGADVQALATLLAPDVYEAYRLGKSARQEYLPMWHEKPAEDHGLPRVEITAAARAVLDSEWLAVRDEAMRAEGRAQHLAEAEAYERKAKVEALREFEPKCPQHGSRCAPPCRLPEYLRNQLDEAARQIESPQAVHA